MDREEALHNFYSGFSIPAYDELSVPEKAPLPYITYPVSIGKLNQPVTVNPSIWYKSKKWTDIDAKAKEIMDGMDGHQIKYDNGAILLFAGSPKYQRLDSGDDTIRRIALNIQMEFLER